MSFDRPKISAIVPCLDEEETLGACIQKAQRAFATLGITGEVVIGDNGSTDRSIDIALELGACVVHQPVKGYGAALRAAIEGAQAEYMVMADADGSYDWENLKPFIDAMDAGADLVVGNRFAGGIQPGAMPPLHRYLGNPVLSFLGRRLYRIPVRDFHCGQRGFTRAAYTRMQLQTTGMEFATEMIVRAARAGLRIDEVPVTLHPDGRSRPPHLRSFRDGWRHLKFILTYAPNALYFVPGSLFLFMGVALQAMLIGGPLRFGTLFLGPHFLALACLMALLGFNLLMLGIIAKLAMWRDMPTVDDRLVLWLRDRYHVEVPVLVGTILAALGFGADVYLLVLRARNQPMDHTPNLAFVATTMLTLGLTTVFGAFLIGLLTNALPRGSGHDP